MKMNWIKDIKFADRPFGFSYKLLEFWNLELNFDFCVFNHPVDDPFYRDILFLILLNILSIFKPNHGWCCSNLELFPEDCFLLDVDNGQWYLWVQPL